MLKTPPKIGKAKASKRGGVRLEGLDKAKQSALDFGTSFSSLDFNLGAYRSSYGRDDKIGFWTYDKLVNLVLDSRDHVLDF